MSTFAQVKAEILADLFPQGNSAILDTAVSRAIISAQKFYENNRFWFNEDNTAIVTTNGQQLYSLGPTFLQIDAVVITDNSDRLNVTQKPFETLNAMNVSNFRGTPKFYATYKECLYFYPVPDSSMTSSISFHKKFADLPGSASGSTTTRWLEDGKELIKKRASIEVLENRIRDYKLAQVYRLQEAEVLQNFKDRTDSLLITGNPTRYI